VVLFEKAPLFRRLGIKRTHIAPASRQQAIGCGAWRDELSGRALTVEFPPRPWTLTVDAASGERPGNDELATGRGLASTVWGAQRPANW
jgi:hypothetical protein